MLEIIPNYVRLILIKEKLYAQLFFGTNYKRVLSEAKEKLETEKTDF